MYICIQQQFAMVTFAATATVNFNFDLNSDVEDAVNDALQLGGTGVNYQAGIDVAVNSVLGSQHDRFVHTNNPIILPCLFFLLQYCKCHPH